MGLKVQKLAGGTKLKEMSIDTLDVLAGGGHHYLVVPSIGLGAYAMIDKNGHVFSLLNLCKDGSYAHYSMTETSFVKVERLVLE